MTDSDRTLAGTSPEQIPVVDFGPAMQGERAAFDRCVADVRAASEHLGFFFIRNHGVPQDLIDRMFEQTERFHALPLERKMEVKALTTSIGYLPLGPRRKDHFAWNDIWGWSIPKSIPAERKKLAKQMLSDMMSDEAGQVELWKKTGAPPPNHELWAKIAKDDAFMRQLQKVSLDVKRKAHAAYYFEKWPGVHKAFSDAVIKAVTGKREDIPKALAEGAPLVSAAAK